MKYTNPDAIMSKAENGGLMEILSASVGIGNPTSDEALVQRFYFAIQSNAFLVMEACEKGFPIDSYIDVVLTLSLQIAIHEYDKNTFSDCSKTMQNGLENLVSGFVASVSRYRGNAHMHLCASLLSSATKKIFPDGPTFSISSAPSTGGERESLRRLGHRVRTLRECARGELKRLDSERRELSGTPTSGTTVTFESSDSPRFSRDERYGEHVPLPTAASPIRSFGGYFGTN